MSAPSRAVYEDGAWSIDLNPAVAARFKRVFDGVAKFGSKVRLSDSPKNAKDLLWFADRHPIEFDPHIRVVAQAALEDEREEAVERILAPDYRPMNVGLALPPRDYQARAIDLAVSNGGLLLADDPGLGKTICGIGISARRDGLPAVIVTLTNLPIQWQREFAKFAPELRTHVLKTASVYPLHIGARGQRVPLPDIVIMSYSKLAGRSGDTWSEWLFRNQYCRSLIFDEIQELRNDDSERYRAAKHLRPAASWCCGMSATPVLNYAGEIFNVVDIVQPGSLGSKKEFIREWCRGTGRDATNEDAEEAQEVKMSSTQMRKVKVADPVALGAHLRETGVFLRRKRSDVGRELPPLQRIFHEVEVDEDAFQDQEAELERLCKLFLAKTTDPTKKMKAGGELDWRMRRMTGIAKAMHVAAFVRLLIESGEKVVLFGWHHEVYDLWKRTFEDEHLGNLKPAFYTGRENTPARKDEQQRRFIEGDTDLLIISLRAGAGLDGLQHVCWISVTGEFDWSPGIHEQNETRVFRDGQKNPVSSYYVHTNWGSDPVVMDTLNLKTEQSEGVRNMTTDVAKLSGIDPDHVRKLAESYLKRRGKL